MNATDLTKYDTTVGASLLADINKRLPTLTAQIREMVGKGYSDGFNDAVLDHHVDKVITVVAALVNDVPDDVFESTEGGKTDDYSAHALSALIVCVVGATMFAASTTMEAIQRSEEMLELETSLNDATKVSTAMLVHILEGTGAADASRNKLATFGKEILPAAGLCVMRAYADNLEELKKRAGNEL